MQVTVKEIADLLEAPFEGDGSRVVTGLAGIVEASDGDLTFCSEDKYANLIPDTLATAVLVLPEFKGAGQTTLLRIKDPYGAFVQILRMYRGDTPVRPVGIDPLAVVSATARIGNAVSIGPLCVVEDGAVLEDGVTLCPGTCVGAKSRLGEGSYLFSGVIVRENVSIGKRAIIHSGSVIGSDGFGYHSNAAGHKKIPQIGSVILEDDVEVGANVAIDRGTLGATRIGRGVKIDNLVHVAHNVTVEENTLLVAQVGISGSTRIGRGVTIAGQVGIGGHLTIGDGVQIGGKSGVTKSISENQRVSGYPAMEHNQAQRLNAYYRKLPSLFDQIKELKQRILTLEGEREKIL